MNDEAQTSYRDYAKKQVGTITEALTEVMLGNFSVVARTSEPDDTFGYLCAMINVAIDAARNAQQELQAKIVQMETEVAERKQAEAALRESEERLQLALGASRAGTFDFDVATQYCTWDDRSLEIYGLSEADRCGDAEFFYSLVHPEDRPHLRAVHEQAFASESRYSVDYRIRRPDGDERYVQANGVILRNDQGEAVRAIGVEFDITERKRAEEVLRESEARNRAFLSAIPDMIFTFREDGTYLDFMPAPGVEPYVKPEEFLGKTVHAVLPADKAERTMQDIRRALKTGAVQRHEYTLASGDEQRDFEYRMVPSGDGEVMAIVRDITERKKIEQEREKMLAELEDKNAELERFTYTVSHDLKSPLVTIKGFLGMLRVDARSGNPERMEKDIQYIETATDKMSRLLGELLELSRIGRLMNPPEAVSLTNLADEAVEMVAGQIVARGVNVEVEPEMPVVHGDRVRLVEIFQNLIDNAVKFIGDQERPRVEIGATKQNGEILCSVRDNGIGIDSRYHEKVFGLFERLGIEAEGTGIGLALVKRIVEVHGGRVWVESQGEGHGSTFWFTLPEHGVSMAPAK